MIRTWKITESRLEEIHFPDHSSLDAITRQLPDGYYSTFRTYGGCTRVLGLSAHLRRLPDLDVALLRRQLIQLLESYRPEEARVRVMRTMQGQVYIFMEPLKLLPRQVYEKGVRAETTETQRDDPRMKSTAFIGQSDNERKNIARTGFFEALLVKNGRILEGMTSNFFYVSDPRAPESASGPRERSEARLPRRAQTKRTQRDILCTAQRNILLGITRRTVIQVARGRGLEMRYRSLRTDRLPAVYEAFITSSSRGIVPVIQIDNVTVGEGRPGETTKMLMSAYDEYVLRTAEKI